VLVYFTFLTIHANTGRMYSSYFNVQLV